MKLTFNIVFFLVGASAAYGLTPCRVEVVDKQNGWPVPLVEFRTTHDLVLVTDNAGVIAIDQPELMDREVWFGVSGHGYAPPADGFGMRGVRLTPKAGETVRVEVERASIAKRLGRLTGGGIFAESQKCGQRLDWPESGVFGAMSWGGAQRRAALGSRSHNAHRPQRVRTAGEKGDAAHCLPPAIEIDSLGSLSYSWR